MKVEFSRVKIENEWRGRNPTKVVFFTCFAKPRRKFSNWTFHLATGHKNLWSYENKLRKHGTLLLSRIDKSAILHKKVNSYHSKKAANITKFLQARGGLLEKILKAFNRIEGYQLRQPFLCHTRLCPGGSWNTCANIVSMRTCHQVFAIIC